MSKPSSDERTEKSLAKNRRATFDYALEDHFEAGMVLRGSEVKSIRAGALNLGDAWGSVEPDGVYLKSMNIQPLPHTAFPHDPMRPRKLLLRAREIEQIRTSVEQRHMTLVPLRVYLKNGLIKTEVALARAKKKGDKRESIKEREANRDARSAVRRALKG
jgi:SsrA-binding protein